MDFAKICITPKPSGAPMGKVPLPILKELKHQANRIYPPSSLLLPLPRVPPPVMPLLRSVSTA